jgi:predicted DNA-binding transcriptional regulator YafY
MDRALIGAAKPTRRAPTTRPPYQRIVWAAARLRSGQSLKATDLAREFEVGIRTAYRDLDFLRDRLGSDFAYDRSQGTYRVRGGASLPPILMSQGEVVALYFAEKVLAQYRGTPFEPDLAAAFAKIQEVMPEQVKVFPDRLLSYLSLDLGPLPTAEPAVFTRVVDALTRRRRLLVRYQSLSGGRTLDRIVEPYRVFNLAGVWYTAAFDHRRNAVRDFALHRIRTATLTDEPFEPDPSFDFKAYMADAFRIEKGGRAVNVAIRFAARQARWIRERPWHRSARIQERLDGGCVLRMRVAVTSELRRFVMQFGSEAEVLAPKALREEVARDLRAAGKSYRGER